MGWYVAWFLSTVGVSWGLLECVDCRVRGVRLVARWCVAVLMLVGALSGVFAMVCLLWWSVR